MFLWEEVALSDTRKCWVDCLFAGAPSEGGNLHMACASRDTVSETGR
jgi:hypothetical protein